jgi:hypothetical protein
MSPLRSSLFIDGHPTIRHRVLRDSFRGLLDAVGRSAARDRQRSTPFTPFSRRRLLAPLVTLRHENGSGRSRTGKRLTAFVF